MEDGYFKYVCVFVCVCVRACVCARVRVGAVVVVYVGSNVTKDEKNESNVFYALTGVSVPEDKVL